MKAAVDLFRLLAEPVRCQLYERLASEGELNVAALTRNSGISQPAVSQHLAALKIGGLIESRPAGRSTFYSVHPEGLVPVREWMRRYTTFWNDRFDALEAYLDREEQP